MALYADRVKDTTTSTGTGSITLANSAPTGYQTFATAFGSTSQTVAYCIADQSGSTWEVGTGVFNGTTGLTRATVLASSNAGSLVNFTAGTKDVFCTAPAKYLDTFTSTNQGTVPASGGSTTNFLRADGTWATPAGGGSVGPPGMMGEDGADGDAGPPGLAGSAGQAGATGARGQIGPAGEDGSDAESFLIGIPTPQAAGATTQIQYNNAGAFGASSNFSYVSGTFTVTVGNITGITSTSGATSPTMTLQTGAPTATQNGGALTVNTANATAATKAAGGITIRAGNGLTSGLGGSISITAGNTPINLPSGAVSLSGGTGVIGGPINVSGGIGTTGVGGDVSMTGGSSSGSTGGGVVVTGGTAPRAGNVVVAAGASSLGNGTGAGVTMFGGNPAGAGGSAAFYGGDAGVFNGQIGGGISFTTGLGDSGANNGAITFNTPLGQALKFLDDTVSAVQIGFFGATPVAQPTTATASATRAAVIGTVANVGDTYDGYTLAQVVKALRNLGILA